MEHENKPWIEKYRPQEIYDVILDDSNQRIISNIIEKRYFPNLLLYGPPGTGKTTTIMNLIKAYFNGEKINNCVMHLNASDDRGIDVIRNQIYNFVHFKQIFDNKLKFVILDEVDYMTKSAQNTLRQIIQDYSNVRFCLICNYISKIVKSLQNNFLKLYFYNNDTEKVFELMNKINISENLNISSDGLNVLIQYYRTDIRSMINHLQSMQSKSQSSLQIMNINVFTDFLNSIKSIQGSEDHVKKLKCMDKKIKYFLHEHNITFESFYIYAMTHFQHHYTINDNIIEKMKILYFDSINSVDIKVMYFLNQIFIPILSLEP